MRGTSHILIGAATGFALANQLDYNITTTIGLTVLGSIIIDIDTKNSTINKILFPVKSKHRNIMKGAVGGGFLLLSNIFLKYIGALILLSIISEKVVYKFSFFKGIQKYEYHRTIFHDPIIGTIIFLLPLLIIKVPLEITIPFITGIGLHYLADSFTSYGLPFYLLGGKIKRMPISYNSQNLIAEYIIVAGFVLTIIAVSDFGLFNSKNL